jgi:large subunit ribosomal protein L20
MVRATCSVARLRRKKRLFKLAKGFWGDRKNHLRLTSNCVMTALSNNYKHRKKKKRDFRGLWINRLSVATKINGISYSKFIFGLKKAGCTLNRKVLSEMAIQDPESFTAVCSEAKKALAA